MADRFGAGEIADAVKHDVHFGRGRGAGELGQPKSFFFDFGAGQRVARIAARLIDAAVECAAIVGFDGDFCRSIAPDTPDRPRDREPC